MSDATANTAEPQPLDFSQPAKFTAELRRRIVRVMDSFCKEGAAQMTSELRAPVEMRQVGTRQVAYGAARAELPEESLAVTLDVKPFGGELVLALDRQFVMRALSRMLGGDPAEAPQARTLSDIDRALTQRILRSIVGRLSADWRELGGLELSLREAEADDEEEIFSVPMAEPTLVVALECTLAEYQSELSLLIPWSAVEPVAGELADRGHARGSSPDPRETDALRHGLARAKMLVRAEIGAAQLPVEQVLEIREGTLLTLDAKAADGVRLLADRVVLARGAPGRSGPRKAVKLVSGIEPRTDGSIPSLPASRPRNGAGSRAEAESMLERLSHLRDVDVRVWGELGRARVSMGSALRLQRGAVLELDQRAEDLVALFVGGVRLASGALLVTSDGEWAMQVSTLG